MTTSQRLHPSRGLRELARTLIRRPRVPNYIRNKYRSLTPDGMRCLEDSLRGGFFSNAKGSAAATDAYLATLEGQSDLADHVSGRLQQFRTWVVPWLDSLFTLEGARILEVGCGTGASTVALAEQGADVVGLDISSAALSSARDRCAAYGLHAEFVQTNVSSVGSLFTADRFDAILFFAVLEHLTWDERMESLRAAWKLLPPNGILGIIEAPNRLWYLDIHTTSEPFYHWLPDEAAIAYTRFLHMADGNLFEEPIDQAKLHLARLGRGVSYHDFVIAWNIVGEKLPIIGDMASFHARRWSKVIASLSGSNRYRKFLSGVAPGLHPAFFQASLDLAFKKPAVDQSE